MPKPLSQKSKIFASSPGRRTKSLAVLETPCVSPALAKSLYTKENADIRSSHAGFRLGSCQDACASHEHRTDLALKAIPAPNEKRAGRGPGEGGFESGSYQLSASPGRVLCFLSWRNKKGRPPAGVGEHLPLSQHFTRTQCPNLSVKNQRFLPALLPGEPRAAVIETLCISLTLSETFCCVKSLSMF